MEQQSKFGTVCGYIAKGCGVVILGIFTTILGALGVEEVKKTKHRMNMQKAAAESVISSLKAQNELVKQYADSVLSETESKAAETASDISEQ